MKPIQILLGDVISALATIPDSTFDCIVTSPPYWGLRDYGVPGQLGLEPTLGEHLQVMVDVSRELRRVLKPAGTYWLNYGDCYATTPNGRSAADTKAAGSDDRTFRDKPFSTIQGTLKPRDLCMVPNRLAIALQDDGWWVRSEIIWGKANGMPDSSGRFRPSTAHEKIFLFTKSDNVNFWVARDTGEISQNPDLSELCAAKTTGKDTRRWIGLANFYNAKEVVQDTVVTTKKRMLQDIDSQNGSFRTYGDPDRKPMKAVSRTDKQRGHSRRHAGFNERWDSMTKEEQGENGRLLRNYEPAPLPVWEMATSAFSEAHFATFPPELAARAIRAGCPDSGHVLDPFGGSGTTALVARGLGRDCTIIELNPEYVEMAERRINDGWDFFPPAVVTNITP